MADPAPVSLCVACGYRDSINGDFCKQCSEQKLVDDYWQEDAEALEVRRNDWKTRSSSTLAQNERQHRSRLLRATRPAERPDAFADPLEIAHQALQKCKYIRRAVGSSINAREYLEQVEEALRQLAWGPPAAPKVPGGRIGMHNRWHVKGGKPCNCPPPLRSRTTP